MTVDRFDDTLLETAEKSYVRCCDDPNFFNEFYALFLGKNPAIPPLFKDTDFHRQNQLLKHAIGLLMAYYKHREGALLAASPGGTDRTIWRSKATYTQSGSIA